MDLKEIQAQAEKLAFDIVAQRAKVDLFYLCKHILGGENVLDAKVHGPLARALRPLLFYKDPQECLKYEFPSDYGREEEEGMPTEAQKLEFIEWQRQFEPNIEASHAVGDRFDVNLKKVLALMPRGTLKSTLITIGFTIQWHLNYPNDRVLIDSETFTKSKAFLAEIKGHYESTEPLRKLYHYIYGKYPDTKKTRDTPNGTENWSTEMIVLTCRKRKLKEPSIDCAGIDVTKNGMHYDLIIADDLHSEKNTQNAEQIENVKQHYRLIHSLLEPEHPLAVIGTRWNFDDLYQMIIDEEFEDYNFITRSAESDDGTVLFYPKRLSREYLDSQLKLQKSYIYSCQYLNNPNDDTTATFRRSDFLYIPVKEVMRRNINWYGLVDPSYKGPYSDYAALVIGGVDAEDNNYLLHVTREKMRYSEIIDKMYELDEIYKPLMWQLEVIGTRSLEHDLETAQMNATLEGRKRLRVTLVRKYDKSKEDRIKAMAPKYERHKVFHVTGAHQLDVLETELIKFPRSRFDDAGDAWSGILTVGRRPRRDVGDAATMQKYKERITMLTKPRSPMVGY